MPSTTCWTPRTASPCCPPGQQAFTGRNGEKLWNEIGAVVADRWDEVVDALDAIVTTPEVDAEALETGQAEAAAISAAEKVSKSSPWRHARPRPSEAEVDEDRDEDLEFWDETGVDCLEITVGGRTGYTLRCYLGEDPVFLSDRRPDPDLLLARGPGELPDGDRPDSTAWPRSRSGRTSARRSSMARRRCWPAPRTPTCWTVWTPELLEGPDAVDRKQLELGRRTAGRCGPAAR